MFSDAYLPNWLEALPCANGHLHDATMFQLGLFLPSLGIVFFSSSSNFFVEIL